MTDDTRYDLWMTEVTDPMQAMTALTEALGDMGRAREAVLSTPSMLVHGASAEEMQTLSTRLSSCGITLEARPSRRPVPASGGSDVQPRPASRPPAARPPAAAGTGASGTFPPPAGARPAGPAPAVVAGGRPSPAGPAVVQDTGVAKVSFYAALVAAPAYVLQPGALLMMALLTVISVGATFSAASGSIIVMVTAPIAAFVLRFGVFAQIVRRSHAGQSDLTLSEGESMGNLTFAGVRFVIMTLVAMLPAFLVVWSLGPSAFAQVAMNGPSAGLGFGATLLLALALPLVALPGAYAATALGSGCGGLNPFIGLVVARRIPGPYFTTLAYLIAFWFASAALVSGGGLLMFSSVIDSVSGGAGGAGAVASMVFVLGVLTLLDITSMVIAGRILGLLTYHYSEELGL